MTLGIRPEHIALSSQSAGGVPLVMDTLEMLGADNPPTVAGATISWWCALHIRTDRSRAVRCGCICRRITCTFLTVKQDNVYEQLALPHVAAHRGGGKLAPENTLAAIDVGARYGHTMIEFDAKLSKDGHIFLLHDDNLERTSNGWGVAGDLEWNDLLKVDAGGWFGGEFKGEPLPLLSQVADRCRQYGMMANIEIKPTTGTGSLTGKVVALAARELWADMPTPLLSSFEIDALEAAKAAAPELPRGCCWMNGAMTGGS